MSALLVRDYYLSEVEHLTRCGESAQAISDHLGVTPAALAKAMERSFRPDLARPFHALVRATRKSRCVDCGRPKSGDSRHPRCRSCSQPVRIATRYGRSWAA